MSKTRHRLGAVRAYQSPFRKHWLEGSVFYRKGGLLTENFASKMTAPSLCLGNSWFAGFILKVSLRDLLI